MIDINWDEAPEGATHFGIATSVYVEGWYKIEGDTYKFMRPHNVEWINGHNRMPEDLIPKPLQPAFTEAMRDNNELPPIGSEYLDEDNQLCKALFHFSSFVIGQMLDNPPIQQYPVFSTARNDRTNIVTPPIELINGKAYQFNFVADDVVFGIYNSHRNILSVEQGTYFDIARVTNIKLLEVKQ